MARTVRLLVFACAVAGLLVLTASPASAHTISGPKPTDYQVRVVKVDPPAPGVTVRIVDLGSKVELTNDTKTDVIVKGYDGEPYLRVGPSGVYENLHSAATYVNRSLKGAVLPPGFTTSPTPEWHKISDGHTVRWHDHNTHWMGATLPPVVANSPGAFHHVQVGHVVFDHDGTTSDATVAVDWVPASSSAPWIPVILITFVVAFVVALLGTAWSRVLAVLVGLLVLFDALHAIAYEMARTGSVAAKVGQFFGGSFVSVAVWIAAIPTAIGLWRRRIDALYGVVFVGLMIALVGGATDLSALWHSQLPVAGPHWLTRFEVAFALGAGAGVALGALVHMFSRGRVTRQEDDAGTRWLSSLVVGLDDAELKRIAAELDADEILDAALVDLADRCALCRDEFDAGSLVFDVLAADDEGPHVRSIVRSGDTLALRVGRAEPVAAEVAVSFPVLLQLLAGTLSLERARDAQRARVSGSESFVAAIAPRLSERSAVPTDDRAPAS
jgi:hypothetical protein